MIDGGYDSGYRVCPCFWGSDPGSLIARLTEIIPCFKGLQVLDAGCGEGKNALFLAGKGAVVQAYDISQLAIQHAEDLKSGHQTENVSFHAQDIRTIHLGMSFFDVVIAYGLMHCLPDEDEIRSLSALLQNATKEGGYIILCAFNDRLQDLSAHPGFNPTLLPHTAYLGLFAVWETVEASDKDLHETHPNNDIPHTHSMTRIIARKPGSAREMAAANA
jgi:cyclopropane fatty-acyl-phospholipid synthase-like methyltransferase